jgi:hypothetical protein
MASKGAIRAMQRSRAEIAGQLERYEAIVRQLRADLVHLDEAIRALDPDADTSIAAPTLPTRRGAMAPVIFDTLRIAERGCTVRELAMHVMIERDLDTGNRKLLGELTERVSGLLRHYRRRGVLRSIRSAGKYIYWEIVPRDDEAGD